MKNKKEDAYFIIYGTYRAEEIDTFKKELEKRGIPVKVIYPGTEIGREVTAQAYWPAYQLMIRACDFQKAEKTRKEFSIKPIESKEKMPLPKCYIWAKNGLARYSLIVYLLSFLGIFITGYLPDIFSEDASFYFIVLAFASFCVWLGSLFYNILREK